MNSFKFFLNIVMESLFSAITTGTCSNKTYEQFISTFVSASPCLCIVVLIHCNELKKTVLTMFTVSYMLLYVCLCDVITSNMIVVFDDLTSLAVVCPHFLMLLICGCPVNTDYFIALCAFKTDCC